MCVITGYCKRGVYLEITPEITLDRGGVCGDYMVFEEKEKIDLNARNGELIRILEKCGSEDEGNYK